MIQTTDLLVIWTTPPGRFELNAALEFVSPKTIIYFCIESEVGDINHFLEKLIGLVKFGIRKYQGHLDVRKLASALAQREATVAKGIKCLQAGGYIKIVEINDLVLKVTDGDQVTLPEKKLLMDQLQIMLRETLAFRDYIKSVDYKIFEMGI